MANAPDKKLLDHTNRQIIALLQENARIPYRAIGQAVGLTSPAVAERIRKLEEAGIIAGYHASVALPEADRGICAFIRLRTPTPHYGRVIALAQTSPRILECHHVSGEDAFMLKVIVSATEELEALIGQLSSYGQTTTAIVLSTSVDR
ncbi:MAG: Lrp/AsnC family transcriptional regulator [Anaerolineae bacterium]